MSTDVDDLSPEARAALANGSAWDDLDPAFRDEACERVLARVEASIAQRAPSTADPRSRLRRALGAAALAALLMGAAVIVARRPPATDRPGSVPSRPTLPASGDAELVLLPPSSANEASSAVPTIDVHALPTSKASPRAAPAPEEGTLGAELRLTSGARAALARGDGAAALRSIDEHERAFPQGELAQERDSLRIQALVAEGDLAEARSRAHAFRQRYPGGLLVPSVERALSVADD